MERRLRLNVVSHPALRRSRSGLTLTYSEVIYETQSPFVVPERLGDGGLLEAAIDLAQRARRLFELGPGRTLGFFVELHAKHATGGSVQPDRPAAGFVQRNDDSAARPEHFAAEVTARHKSARGLPRFSCTVLTGPIRGQSALPGRRGPFGRSAGR
jgi:hypothetical protein